VNVADDRPGSGRSAGMSCDHGWMVVPDAVNCANHEVVRPLMSDMNLVCCASYYEEAALTVRLNEGDSPRGCGWLHFPKRDLQFLG
jgi:hypothetical protein